MYQASTAQKISMYERAFRSHAKQVSAINNTFNTKHTKETPKKCDESAILLAPQNTNKSDEVFIELSVLSPAWELDF